MRKIVVLLVSIFTFMIVPISTASAHGYSNWHKPVNVYGVVREDGKVIRRAHVEVTCDNYTRWTTTDRHGRYDVTFYGRNCTTGDNVSATASKNSESGANNTKVPKNRNVRLNISLISASVPELGLVTGIGALLLSGMAFMLIRRRNYSEVN